VAAISVRRRSLIWRFMHCWLLDGHHHQHANADADQGDQGNAEDGEQDTAGP
jgi:hypothetical protein